MKINIITLFPAMFSCVFEESIIKRATSRDIVNIQLIDLREFGLGKHRVVDDVPYGGGGGMVMKPEPIAAALSSVEDKGHVILTSPSGRLFSQADAMRLKDIKTITIICGHYEGVDERVTSLLVDEELSVGDFVLTGGEIPAMVITDSVVRLIPDVLGCDTLLTGDSHYDGLLEHPQYTRPPQFMDAKVPEVLLSGNHEQIRRWRKKQSLLKTLRIRPDMFEKYKMSKEETALFEQDE